MGILEVTYPRTFLRRLVHALVLPVGAAEATASRAESEAKVQVVFMLAIVTVK